MIEIEGPISAYRLYTPSKGHKDLGFPFDCSFDSPIIGGGGGAVQVHQPSHRRKR